MERNSTIASDRSNGLPTVPLIEVIARLVDVLQLLISLMQSMEESASGALS
ncbi:MAG TPA: hypothetical protein V6D18_15445 [Thermosynechococcaceae cyanobacterium]